MRKENTAGWYATLLDRFNSGDFAGMVASARRMLKRCPRDGKLWHLLAVARLQMGEDEAAEAALRRASVLLPRDPEVWEHFGIALCRLARYPLATQCFERSLSIAPGKAVTWSNAAKNANDAGCFAEGLRYARQAVALDPSNAAGYGNLGNALKTLGQPGEAVASYRRALELAPRSPEAHNNLGVILQEFGQLDAARACYLQALALNPGYVDACHNLGNALKDQGRLDEAVAHYRQALTLKPDKASYHSNLLFCLSHQETLTPAEIFAAHMTFGERFQTVLPSAPAHPNPRVPLRRLRLGFVSGDLRDHAVAYFIDPVWAALDPRRVELWVYSNHRNEDQITTRLRAHSHVWRQVVSLTDKSLAEQIRADGIDVLVDLSGHTAHNRLLTFARKPAPVQVTWLGYPNTTGLQAMDYVLCDRFNAPLGSYEHFYVEKFARLPSSGTFAPAAEAPPLNALPALSKGSVTFGSFNRPSKLGEQVIATWSRVLAAVADSRLLLGNVSDPPLAQQLSERFGRYGIGPERLVFRPKVPLHDYLTLHHEVDIILDTWPYTGGTTTNHALWMGVPVVTLLGPTRAHCQSAAVLGRMGLEDWVAQDTESFVRLAVQWANATQELASLRAGLRERWQTAPLRQPRTVARGLEQAVQVMWQRWCAGLPAEHFEIGPEWVFGASEQL